MKKVHIFRILFFSLLIVASIGQFSFASEEPQVEESKWDQAGKEMKEATDAVVDATKDSSQKAWQKTKEESSELYEKAGEESQELWEKTKKTTGETWENIKIESVEAWEKAKEGSAEMYDKAKAKVHEATAPDPVEGEPDPAK